MQRGAVVWVALHGTCMMKIMNDLLFAPPFGVHKSVSTVWCSQISCKEGAIVGGILLGYLVSYLVVDWEGGWRFILGTELPLALVLGAGEYIPTLDHLIMYVSYLGGDW